MDTPHTRWGIRSARQSVQIYAQRSSHQTASEGCGFEVNGFLQNDSYYERTVKLHSWIDNIHNEENRLDTIKEIVPKDEQDNFRNPLKLYHSNWKDIDKCAHTFATRVGMYFAKHHA